MSNRGIGKLPKAWKITGLRKAGDDAVAYMCPGCGSVHAVPVDPGGWEFNWNYDCPTLKPSLKVTTTHMDKVLICHSVVQNGMAYFCEDCTHPNANKIMEIPEREV